MKNPQAARLKRKLKVLQSNFSLGLMLVGSLADSKKKELCIKNTVVIKQEGIFFVPSGKELHIASGESFYHFDTAGNPDLDFKHAILEFSKMLIRNVTLDSFEALYNYCKENGLEAHIHSQPWYRFARLVRNCLTHTQKVHFADYQLKWLPVTWQGNTIDRDLEGKELPFTVYGYWETCELLSEMQEFAETV
jgi:hypothetical protein